MPVAPDDYAWIRLSEQPHLSTCLAIANKRQANASAYGLPPKNGAPTDYREALDLHIAGIYGEAAAKIYLNPVSWNAYRPGRNFTEADLEDWIDVKTCKSDLHNLIVQKDDPDDWAYLLVCSQQHPLYCITGWVWGREAKQSEFWSDPRGGRPAFFIRREHLHPPADLHAEVRRRQEAIRS